MGWDDTLLSSVGNEATLTDKAEELRQELLDHYDNRDVSQGRFLLETLTDLFSQKSEAVLALVDRVSLYLCSPCLVLGCLSPECCNLSFKALSSMLSKASAREVFTGLTDGVSLLLETASFAEMVRVIPVILDSLVSCIEGISRKKESFCAISLHLIHRIAKKLRDSYDGTEGTISELSLCRFLKAGHQISTGKLTSSDRLRAFAILVVQCFLSLLSWRKPVYGATPDPLNQEIQEEVGELLRCLEYRLISIEESVVFMSEAWCSDGDNSDLEESDRASVKRELTRGCWLLMWASMQHSQIPTLFSDDVEEVITAMLRVSPEQSESHYVLAAMDMLRTYWKPSSLHNTAFWETVCSLLIEHMEHNPVLHIKSEAADGLQAILRGMPEQQRWILIKELVYTSCSDIAGLVVQQLRASVVQTCKSNNTASVFASPQVLELMMDLLKSSNSEDELIERAELYSAVLNLCFFLVNTESNHTVPILVAVKEASKSIESKVRSLQSQLSSALQQNEMELRLQRLQLNINDLLKRIVR